MQNAMKYSGVAIFTRQRAAILPFLQRTALDNIIYEIKSGLLKEARKHAARRL